MLEIRILQKNILLWKELSQIFYSYNLIFFKRYKYEILLVNKKTSCHVYDWYLKGAQAIVYIYM